MLYTPKHWHQALPLLTSLLGFYLVHNLQPTYDVVGVFITLQLLALSHSGWIILLSYPYQRYITWVNTPDEPKIPTIEPPDPGGWKSLPNLNVSQQAVELPTFDMERYFAFTLCRMHENFPELEPDLTERKWVINTKKFSQKPFAALKAKWESHGVIVKKSAAKNSRHVVRRWDAVQLIAAGNPLPPLPH
jgi:hypothetical protein